MKTQNRFIHWMHLVVSFSLLLAITAINRPVLAQSSCGSTFTVRSGDTLSGIAVLCGVTLTALEQSNTQISTPDLIFPNQVINLTPGVIPVTGGQGAYTVKPGDTLAGIAGRFNTTIDALTRANPQATNINLLTVGEILNIPGSLTTINSQTVYIVKNGDFMSSIAAAQGVSLAVLEQANPAITDPTLIFPGQQIVIPGTGIPVTGGGQASISLNPAIGNAGSQVMVSGSGFAANTALNVSVTQGAATASTVPVTSDDKGAFSVAVTIPNSAGPGSAWTIKVAPQSGAGSSAAATFQVAAQAPAGFYPVVAGDTLLSIAGKFNTTVDALLRANPGLTSASTLSAGQQLFVPGSLVTTNGQTLYVVKSGDFLSQIAVDRGVTLAALEQANPQITDPSLVLPGDHVFVP